MIGAIISLKYFGKPKKTWGQALVFWLVYIVAAAVLASLVPMGIVGSAVVFILLAHYWYHFNWFMSLKLFAIALVIDIIIVIILIVLFTAAIFAWLIPSLTETSSFLMG